MYASPRFTEGSMMQIYETEAFADTAMFKDFDYIKWSLSGHRSYNVSLQKVKLVSEYLPTNSLIVDVGCAMGLFVKVAKSNGYNAIGVEPSSKLCEIATKIVQAEVYNCTVEDFQCPKPADAIVIWDVLEHVYDPVRILRACTKMLRQGGYVFLQVPNYKGIANRLKTLLHRLHLKNRSFKHFGFPWHVYAFDKRSINYLLNLVGLQSIKLESWSHFKKDNSQSPIAKLISDFVLNRCLSDYIVCIAQKP